MHRNCISAKVCTLVLTFCILFFAYSAFFSDQITLSWELTGSVYNPISSAQGFAPHSTAPTNLSNIIFVLAGSTLTWDQRRAYTELWWRRNHTRGHVWLDQAPAAPWPDSCPPYMVSRDMSRYGEKASASRIAAAVVEAYQLVSSGSENDRVHWFLTKDYCYQLINKTSQFDDQVQVDIRGDVYGMLAAHPIVPLVSLHQLDYVKPISSNKHSQLESVQSLFSAYQVDPSRFLQQTFCYEVGTGVRSVLSISVSWGYTVQVYPLFMTPNMLETPLQTFKTWRSSREPFTFNTRQIGDPCARPFIFLFDRVLHNLTDATLTQYSRANTSIDEAQTQEEAMAKCDKWGTSAASGIDVVRVSAPKMDPFSWQQAPRRWCCTARRTKRGRMLNVQIKYCSPGEPTIPRLPT